MREATEPRQPDIKAVEAGPRPSPAEAYSGPFEIVFPSEKAMTAWMRDIGVEYTPIDEEEENPTCLLITPDDEGKIVAIKAYPHPYHSVPLAEWYADSEEEYMREEFRKILEALDEEG